MNLLIRLLPVALIVTACGSKIKKEEELARVKRVAIIGLDLKQQKSISGTDLAAMAMKTGAGSSAQPTLRTDSDHVADVYKQIAGKIEKRKGWRVLSEQEVKANPAYARFFKDKTEGFQNRPIMNDRYNLYTTPGILDSFPIMTAKQQLLADLAKALNVDALVYVSSQVDLNNSSTIASLVGKGEFKPIAMGTLIILDARSGEKIFMRSIEGPEVAQGERNALGMADESKLNLLAQKATASSMDLILKEL